MYGSQRKSKRVGRVCVGVETSKRTPPQKRTRARAHVRKAYAITANVYVYVVNVRHLAHVGGVNVHSYYVTVRTAHIRRTVGIRKAMMFYVLMPGGVWLSVSYIYSLIPVTKILR